MSGSPLRPSTGVPATPTGPPGSRPRRRPWPRSPPAVSHDLQPWQACADAGDLYRRHYEGLYCVGCEQFYTADELPGGRCPEHGTEPQPVSEENWFFRLSRYAGQLHDLIAGGALRIEPAERRNEVLALIAGGLDDFSVSRSTDRAHGWGIPVPGDPGQVIYVWWDALGIAGPVIPEPTAR
jgi:methionyl-tRNA synthetase